MNQYNDPTLINVGTGKDIAIKDVALLIQEIVGYQGELVFDSSKPDGTPRKLLDVSKLTGTGWRPQYILQEGIKLTYTWFKEHYDKILERERTLNKKE